MTKHMDGQLPGELGEQFLQLLAEFEAANAELDRELGEQATETAESRDELARRARSGELGPEWRTVQNRIDIGETSLEAVFSGEDTTTQAAMLRERARKNLGELGEQWQEQDDAPNGEPSPVRELRGQAAANQAAFLAQLEEITAVLGRLGTPRAEGGRE